MLLPFIHYRDKISSAVFIVPKNEIGTADYLSGFLRSERNAQLGPIWSGSVKTVPLDNISDYYEVYSKLS